MKTEEWFKKQDIQPVQDRKDYVDYESNYNLYTEVDLLECLEAYHREKMEELGNVSDGYHTHKELYEYRKIYNAMLFNEWAKREDSAGETLWHVHKSKRHSDGELCFGGGWFIVVAELPTGMISNHYKLEDWDLFQIDEYDVSPIEYDGHTPEQALQRMKEFLKIKGE